MNFQMPFSFWDILAALAAQVPIIVGVFWDALTPSTKLLLVLLLAIAICLPSSPSRKPVTYRHRRRRWTRRRDY